MTMSERIALIDDFIDEEIIEKSKDEKFVKLS